MRMYVCQDEFTVRIEHSIKSKNDVSTTHIGGKVIGGNVRRKYRLAWT